MSRNTKLLAGCVGILLLCVCACGITFVAAPTVLFGLLGSSGAGVSEDPTKARQVATAMADYTLPPGYIERASADFLVAKLVVITSANDDGMAIVMGQAAGMSRADLEKTMRDQLSQRAEIQMRQVGTEQVTIKGKPAQMNLYESAGGEGVRQGVVGFDGKNGQVVLMFFGQEGTWDQQAITRFLASIR